MATKGRSDSSSAKGVGKSGRSGQGKGSKGRNPASQGRKKKKKSVFGRVRSALHRFGLRRISVVLAALLILAALASGLRALTKALGPEDYDTSTVEFRANGSIRVTSVESFEEDYYDAAELKNEIKTAVSDYNDSNGTGSVKQSDFSVENETAKVVLTYQSAEDYRSFNGMDLFMGTVQEAQDEGYDFESILSAVSQEDSSRILNQDTLEELAGNDAIILTEQANVVVSREILYVTPNLEVTKQTEAAAVDTISADSPAIIILR